MLDYTPQQINLLTHFAVARMNRESFTQAHTVAVGSAVGFTGQSDILKKLGEDLGVEVKASNAVPAGLRGLLMAAVKDARTKLQQVEDGD